MIGREGGSPERPALFFDDAAEFRAWLEAHHDTAPELWMGLNKVHVSPRGLTWEDAVPQALCFGWIDSVSQRIDEDARRQRWTPRRRGSTWSLVNVAHVERLTAHGLMHPAGLAAFEARHQARTGVHSFEVPPGELAAPDAAALAAHPVAQAWWEGASASYRRLVTNWLASAKRPETHDRRLAQLIDDSAAGRLIPSQRYGEEPGWARRLRRELDLGQD